MERKKAYRINEKLKRVGGRQRRNEICLTKAALG